METRPPFHKTSSDSLAFLHVAGHHVAGTINQSVVIHRIRKFHAMARLALAVAKKTTRRRFPEMTRALDTPFVKVGSAALCPRPDPVYRAVAWPQNDI